MRLQQPANQRRPAAFGLKKAAAWLHRHPLAVELRRLLMAQGYSKAEAAYLARQIGGAV